MKELRRRRKAARSLVDHAVEIGPRHQGGVWLVPEVDARAALEREAELKRKVGELEDELENVLIGLFLEERLAKSSGKTVPIEDLVRDLGYEELLEEAR